MLDNRNYNEQGAQEMKAFRMYKTVKIQLT